MDANKAALAASLREWALADLGCSPQDIPDISDLAGGPLLRQWKTAKPLWEHVIKHVKDCPDAAICRANALLERSSSVAGAAEVSKLENELRVAEAGIKNLMEEVQREEKLLAEAAGNLRNSHFGQSEFREPTYQAERTARIATAVFNAHEIRSNRLTQVVSGAAAELENALLALQRSEAETAKFFLSDQGTNTEDESEAARLVASISSTLDAAADELAHAIAGTEEQKQGLNTLDDTAGISALFLNRTNAQQHATTGGRFGLTAQTMMTSQFSRPVQTTTSGSEHVAAAHAALDASYANIREFVSTGTSLTVDEPVLPAALIRACTQAADNAARALVDRVDEIDPSVQAKTLREKYCSSVADQQADTAQNYDIADAISTMQADHVNRLAETRRWQHEAERLKGECKKQSGNISASVYRAMMDVAEGELLAVRGQVGPAAALRNKLARQWQLISATRDNCVNLEEVINSLCRVSALMGREILAQQQALARDLASAFCRTEDNSLAVAGEVWQKTSQNELSTFVQYLTAPPAINVPGAASLFIDSLGSSYESILESDRRVAGFAASLCVSKTKDDAHLVRGHEEQLAFLSHPEVALESWVERVASGHEHSSFLNSLSSMHAQTQAELRNVSGLDFTELRATIEAAEDLETSALTQDEVRERDWMPVLDRLTTDAQRLLHDGCKHLQHLMSERWHQPGQHASGDTISVDGRSLSAWLDHYAELVRLQETMRA